MNSNITLSGKSQGFRFFIQPGKFYRSVIQTLTILVSFMAVESFSQQVCCPDFKLKDAVEICPPEGQCQGGTAPGGGHAMAACKLSAHTYTVYPNIGGYTYTWTVTGGTATPVSGNPTTILWGSGTTGFIKVVISGGSCHDSITQEICLIDGPRANFTAVPNPVCAGGLVHFTNTSTGGGNYIWDFGDGTTSTLANPPDHIYTTPGTYTVILTAFDMGAQVQGSDQRKPCGCSDTATVVIQVLSGAGPTIETTCCYGTICPGDTSSFCTPLVCGTYNWSVANGVIISGAGTNCIKVKWNAVYTVPPTVSLSVPGCASAPCPGSTTLHVPVLYPNLPISGPNPLCVGSSGSFFLPSMPGTFYNWTTTAPAGTYTFNDKNRNIANVNMTFNLAGTYQIICNYNNPLAGCSGSSIFTVDVLPIFSIYGLDKICQYSTQPYSASATATWIVTPMTGVSFPPGPAISKNITFNTPGMYVITATPTVSGVYCNANAVKVVEVVAVPVLGAISGPALVCPNKNLTYSITSNTTGSPFTWSVLPAGTGTVMTQFGPDRSQAVINLTGGGPWTVAVYQEIEISPGVLCQSLTQTLSVTKYAAPVVTGPSPVCVDAITTYNASGPVPPGGIQWSISPPVLANRGTLLSPQGGNSMSIRWHGAPTTVNVVASHCGGSGSIPVTILNPPATPVVTANGPTGYCLPSMPPAGFTLCTSTGYCSYQWYDPAGNPISGATSSCYVVNLAYFTGPGSYIFKVEVSNCQCTATGNIQIIIGNNCTGIPPNPVPCAVDFTIAPNPVCENQPATFTAVPGGVFNYQWAFGDGATSFQSPTQHAYLTAGTYSVTLTATLGTCTATKVHTVVVNPTPVCTISAIPDTMFCPGSFITLLGCTGQSSYQWYMDYNPISGATNSTYNAYQHGEYWLEVSNNFGCTNTSNHIYLYEKALPTAKITGDGTVCASPGGLAQFQLSAYYNSDYSYSWYSNPAGATFSPNNSNSSFITNVSITLPGTLPYTCAFIVLVTDTVTGCEKRDTLCVTFYETPTVSVPFYYGCEGPAVTLTATPGPLPPTQYSYQWSNGKTTQSVSVSTAGAYGVTITDKMTGCQASVIGAIINPKPDLSLFPRGCDSICHNDTLHLYIPLPLNWLPPFNTYASAYPDIKWYDNGNFFTPVGSGPQLLFNTPVLGNHQISVVVMNHWGCYDTAGVFCLNVRHCDSIVGIDFGDAPDVLTNPLDYPTLLASNGARHNIVPGIFLGSLVDSEPDGQPSVGADCDDNDCLYLSLGDDEDGVTMPAVIEIGNTYNITVQASVNGFLDAWIDYNVDGDWADAGEHLYITLPVTAGANLLSLPVPAGATPGQSYARFRFRTTTAPITYDGLVSNGEVEDYPVFITECPEGDELDFGDAPDMPPVGYNYPTLLSSNGARHAMYSTIRLGALIDGEADGQPNLPSLGDDWATSDDEDGVVFLHKMYVGMPSNIQVTASVPGFLNAWFDFNKNGNWTDAGEQVFTNQPLATGVNNLTFLIPSTSLQGKIYSRFRFNTTGGLTYAGFAANGEVEDYQVHACPHWWPVHTNIKHYITIPHDLQNMYPGDVLGVFYHDAVGMEACGGISEFNGTDDQMMIVYGDDPNTPVKDGFIIGEPIYWKLCSVVKGDANPVDVVYDFTYPSHDGLFTNNGLSALSAVIGLHVTASAEPGSICTGQSAQLHADVGTAEGVAFSWTSLPAGFMSDQQNPVVAPEENTTYYVDAFDGVFHSFSSVQVSVTQTNPLVDVLPLQDITIPYGQHNCYNAIHTITAAGSEAGLSTTFKVMNGGNVQMISGQHIRLLPGTRGYPGSYLHAYITSVNGPFCCNYMPPPQAKMTGETAGYQLMPDQEKSLFKVYPNPTTGSFTLELSNYAESAKVSVEIYGILGDRILKTEMSGVKQRVFDLSGQQHGVYLVRVTSGSETGMTKIIRQ